MSCPLGKTCSVQKDGTEERCLWFTRMQNEQGHFFDICNLSMIPTMYKKILDLQQEVKALKEAKDADK